MAIYLRSAARADGNGGSGNSCCGYTSILVDGMGRVVGQHCAPCEERRPVVTHSTVILLASLGDY